MEIKLTPIDQIRPYENNPRINDGTVDAVAKSIQEWGFRQPIVVDADGVIIVGHTRWKAAKKLGLSVVPVHVARDLKPEAVQAYRIADNKTAELSDWNYDLLPIELSALQEANYDLGLLGLAIFGSSVTIGCSVATPHRRQTWIVCWPALRFTFAIQIRLTM